MKRKGLLVNFLSPTVYSYVEDCETYDEALVILKACVLKTKKQSSCDSKTTNCRKPLTIPFQALKLLLKDGTFQAVSAEQLIWDAFINGLNSQGICQRLQEKEDLFLEAEYEQAYSLERAQQQSPTYLQPITASVANLQQDRGAFDQRTAVPTNTH